MESSGELKISNNNPNNLLAKSFFLDDDLELNDKESLIKTIIFLGGVWNIL